MTRWKLSVDKNVCISSAMCVALAPGRFVLDEQQRSGPVETEINPDEVVRDAAASCPPPARQKRSAWSMSARDSQ